MAALNKLHEHGVDHLDIDPPDPAASPFEQAVHMMEGLHESLHQNGLEVSEHEASHFAHQAETPTYDHSQDQSDSADILA